MMYLLPVKAIQLAKDLIYRNTYIYADDAQVVPTLHLV